MEAESADSIAYRVEETARGCQRGWRYVPLAKGKKWPSRKAWQDLRATPQQAAQWAAAGNIGLLCGEPSKTDALDLDGEAASRLSEFPATPTVATGGGGYHLLYQAAPAGTIKNWVGKLGEHIDLRTTGGQIVAVGSIHPATGKQYVWAPGLSPDEIDFAPFPVELVQAMVEAQQARHARAQAIKQQAAAAVSPQNIDAPLPPRQPAANDREARRTAAWAAAGLKNNLDAVAAAPEGQGNASVNTAAYNLGQLVGGGFLSEGEVIEGIRQATSAWRASDGNDGAMRAAIESTIQSGLRAGKAHPRKPPFAGESREYAGPAVSEDGEVIEPDHGQAELQPVRGATAVSAATVGADPTGYVPPADQVADGGAVVIPLIPEKATSTGTTGMPGQYVTVGDGSLRLYLDPKKTPPTARAFLHRFYRHTEGHSDGPTLVRYCDLFYRWEAARNCYREIEEMAVTQQISDWLETAVVSRRNAKGQTNWTQFETNNQTIGAAQRAVETQTFIDKETPCPSWIGEPEFPVQQTISFKSDILHVPSGRQIPPTPRLFATNALGYDYCPDAPPPTRWLPFLHEVYEGDAEKIALLQEWFGYCLTTDTRQHKGMLLVGPRRCGKGTIMHVLEHLLGESNVANPKLGALGEESGVAVLRGKSLCAIGDTKWVGRNIREAVETLLGIIGGDGVTIRLLYQNAIPKVQLPTRFLICSNSLPHFEDTAGAMTHRLLILRSNVSFADRVDITLLDTLLKELPGILLWAIEGWKRLQLQGRFTIPAAMQDDVTTLEETTSDVYAFGMACCRFDDKDSTLSPDQAWREWVKWAKQTGVESRMNKGWLMRDLKSAFPQIVRHVNEGYPYYAGIAIKDELTAAGQSTAPIAAQSPRETQDEIPF